MVYKASLDSLAKTMTFIIIILFIVIGQLSVRAILDSEGNTETILIHSITLTLFAAILLSSWLFAPKSYSIENGNLFINRPVGKIVISLDDIAGVRPLTENESQGTIRTFGVGGLFGYFGKFNIPGIGHSDFYATQRRNKILIITKQEKRYLITPDDISMVEKLIPF